MTLAKLKQLDGELSHFQDEIGSEQEAFEIKIPRLRRIRDLCLEIVRRLDRVLPK